MKYSTNVSQHWVQTARIVSMMDEARREEKGLQFSVH